MNSSALGSRSRSRNGDGSMALKSCFSSDTCTSISSQFAGSGTPADAGDVLGIRGATTTCICSLRVRQWLTHDMLGHEPGLQLVTPNDLAYDQIVGSVVPAVRCEASHRSRFLEDDFMGMQQAGDLHGHFFATLRWTRNQR